MGNASGLKRKEQRGASTLSRYREYIQLTKEMEQLYHGMAVSLGLSDSVLNLLYTLYEEGDGRTPTQLYNEWSLSKQTGHSALMWLRERGMVELCPAPGDGRSKRVMLTEEGRRFVKRTVGPLLAAEKAAFSALLPGEQETLITLLRQLSNQLKEEITGREFPAK